jgi:imidazole glycerol phosphate synthase glutamine amidotransferase subunit
MKIRVIDTGSANVRSVHTALRRLRVEPVPVRGPEDVIAAPRILLPGVGAFGAAMRHLHEQDLVEPLRERIRAGWPTLAVCIGLQLLGRTSEESPGVEGIGAVPVTVGRFGAEVRVPHMGWNHVHAPQNSRWIEDGHAYFANSYRIAADQRAALEQAGWSVATCDYAGSFIAAIARDQVLACQFHPELSGAFGLEVLRRWVERTKEADAC